MALAIAMTLMIATPAAAGEPEYGKASWFGPGDGVASQWCTWVRRHRTGCGSAIITSIGPDGTGLSTIAPVIDWCQCYRGEARERIIDLQWDVVAALGLKLADGTYDVVVEWSEYTSPAPRSTMLPNTAMRSSGPHDGRNPHQAPRRGATKGR